LRDREYFLGRLLADPRFLCRHTPDLCAAVYRKVSNVLRLKLASEHRGLKRQPPWLRPPVATGTDSTAFARFPQYPDWPAVSENVAGTQADAEGGADDPEREFASHRWGFLVDPSCAWGRNSDELQPVLRWIEVHSDRAGPAWETYSACERVANLLLYVGARRRQPLGALEQPLVKFVAESLDWIAAHLEYYGSSQTNNHLINNARALVMGGVAIGSAQAYAAGLDILRKTLPEMVLSGGFLRERSSHYQLIVLGWVLDAWKFVAVKQTEEGPDALFLAGYVRNMARAARLLCDRSGLLLASIGDVSPDVTPASSSLRLATLYPEVWPPAEPAPAMELRDGWFRSERADGIVLGNFPMGRHPLPYPHHGHTDYSSFVWTQGGREILTDNGRYRYTADAISLLQTSARGHNVPLVNGFAPVCGSLLRGGAWWPRPYADSTLELNSHGDRMLLKHDGFARATPVRRHTRELMLLDRDLLVSDIFEGTGSVDLQLCWQFGPGFTTFDGVRLIASGAAGEVWLTIDGVRGRPVVEFASGAQPGAWRSTEYGTMIPSLGILLGWRLDLPAAVKTRFELQLCAA